MSRPDFVALNFANKNPLVVVHDKMSLSRLVCYFFIILIVHFRFYLFLIMCEKSYFNPLVIYVLF